VPDYDVVMGLNYYAPYVSGLTEAARMVAEGLVERGQRVAVVAARHDRQTPAQEVVNGVEVFRTPVVARFGKGTISPSLPFRIADLARRSRVLNLHLPMLEAGLVARLSRRTPLVTTYQCDVWLPPSRVNALQVRAIDASSRAALRRSAVIGVSSDDYARHSRLWPAMSGRSRELSPPSLDRSGGTPRFRDGAGLHVGFLGRIVAEKGLEDLVRGFRALPDRDARLLIGGDYTKVAGGSVVEEVRRAIADDPRITLLGFLPDESLPDLYASLDVFALPSVNSLEAFGIVQVEAMRTGVIALATDLPGVRQPIQRTGFGRLVPPHDPAAITAALRELRSDPPDRVDGARRANEEYGLAQSVDAYAEVLAGVSARAGTARS
jgi:glycosyltransferase involved in cell wall biosynthesis